MTQLQELQLWIGLGFVAFLVLFLIVAFFKKADMTQGQQAILKFLCSLCAGFAGALITGDALFRFSSKIGDRTSIAASGTAGAALFFAVWYGFKTWFPDAIRIRVPKGWKFKDVVDQLAQQERATAQYVGFTEEELDAPLEEAHLEAAKTLELIEAMRDLSKQTTIRAYVVVLNPPSCRLTIV